jgi:hypothetical protein
MDEVNTIQAQALNASQLMPDGERGRLEFQTEAGALSITFPRTEVVRLMSLVAQLNQQPEVQAEGFTPVEAFPLAFFQLSGVQTGDLLLSFEARDGGQYAFLMDRARAGRLHEALGQALEVLGRE